MKPEEIIDAAYELDSGNHFDWNFKPLQEIVIGLAAIIAAKQREKDAGICDKASEESLATAKQCGEMALKFIATGASQQASKLAAAIRGQE